MVSIQIIFMIKKISHPKIAIVTGGVRGIGLAIARQLISENFKVVICSRSSTEIKRTLKELNSQSKVAHGQKIDVSNYSECKKLILFAHGIANRIDVLVNNAGIYGPVGPLEGNDLIEWARTININLMGMVFCSSLVIPGMKKNKSGKT